MFIAGQWGGHPGQGSGETVSALTKLSERSNESATARFLSPVSFAADAQPGRRKKVDHVSHPRCCVGFALAGRLRRTACEQLPDSSPAPLRRHLHHHELCRRQTGDLNTSRHKTKAETGASAFVISRILVLTDETEVAGDRSPEPAAPAPTPPASLHAAPAGFLPAQVSVPGPSPRQSAASCCP
jgi:hypothetical protein